MRRVLLALVIARPALAERHVVQRGETIEHVAQVHGCDVDTVLRANGLTSVLVPAGTVIEVPACSIHKRARTRRPPTTAEAKARAALEVIDGTAWVDDTDHGRAGAVSRPVRGEASVPGDARRRGAARIDEADARDAQRIASRLQPWRATILDGAGRRGSRGQPWNGSLDGAEHLDEGDGMHVRRPRRAYGEPHVVEYLRHAVAEVRALYPDVPTLAIGDLSSEHGGALPGHRSHQSGRDVDVGFYFHHGVTGFADASDDLDLDATWALLAAFARTADRGDGVQIIFLDYAVQRRLYDYAKARGTPDDELAFLFQYPAGKDAMRGLVRHWPNHANHFHVRFKR